MIKKNKEILLYDLYHEIIAGIDVGKPRIFYVIKLYVALNIDKISKKFPHCKSPIELIEAQYLSRYDQTRS